MSEPKKYRIETVADFDQVPDESLRACVADFMAYLTIRRLAASMLDEGVAKVTDVFTWVDDGVEGVSSVRFIAPDGEVAWDLSKDPTP